MLGFDMDTSELETEIANCRAIYEKYKGEFWTGARDPRELIQIITKELETAGWEKIREEAQRQVDEGVK
jgi:putative aldouronate transport system substrate-binding protein